MKEKYKTNIREILMLRNEGFNDLYIEEQIEEQFRKEAQEIYNAGCEDSLVDLGKKFLTFIAAPALLIALVIFGVNGCNANSLKEKEIFNNEWNQNQQDIKETLNSCYQGDYSKCRSGWLKYNTEFYSTEVYEQGKYVQYNKVCISFEEAYFNKTGKKLVITRAFLKK